MSSLNKARNQLGTITASEMVYYIYFIIMLLPKALGMYEGMPLYTLSLLAGFILIGIKVCMTKHTVLELLCMAALVLLGFVVWNNSGEKGLLIYIAMIIGIKNVPIGRIFRLGFVVFGISFVSQILYVLLGLKEDFFVIHSKLGLGHMIRWSLGYPHPNVLHISYVVLMAFLLYILNLKGKKNIAAIAACFVGNIYIFMYSVSYTGFALAIVYLACYYYFTVRKEISKTESILIQAVFPACVLFSVAGPLLIRGKLFELIDKVLNTRYSLSNYFLTNEKITLFGSRFDHLIGTNMTLDCSYTMALMRYGIIPFILICIGYIFLIHRYLKEEKEKELAIIIGFVVAGISEPFLFNTSYKNLSLLFMGDYFFMLMMQAKNRGHFKFLKQEIQIIAFGDRTFSLSWLDLHSKAITAGGIWKRGKKVIILLAICTGVTAAIVYGVAARTHLPERVYAVRSNCDDIGEESIYIDINNLPENFNGKILNYVDKDTKMYEFTGNIIIIEYVRGIISSFIWIGAAAGCVSFILYSIIKGRTIIDENING